jgi:hypothetical protein
MEAPRLAAVRIMKLPRERWKGNILDTVEPHLQDMVRKHMSNALWREKWAG